MSAEQDIADAEAALAEFMEHGGKSMQQVEVEIASTHRRLVLRLYSILEELGAKSDLLGIVGSWGDSMDDEEVLDALMKRGRYSFLPCIP